MVKIPGCRRCTAEGAGGGVDTGKGRKASATGHPVVWVDGEGIGNCVCENVLYDHKPGHCTCGKERRAEGAPER